MLLFKCPFPGTKVKEVGCEDVDCIDLTEIVGCCEDGNRPLGYINDRNDGEFLGERSYC